mgnify:CR=1 FL=1
MTADRVEAALKKYKGQISKDDLPSLENYLRLAPDDCMDELMALPIKGKTKTILFSIFLGNIGVDRFYVGDKRKGLLKLFCNLFGGVYFDFYYKLFAKDGILTLIFLFVLYIFWLFCTEFRYIYDIFTTYQKAQQVNFENITKFLDEKSKKILKENEVVRNDAYNNVDGKYVSDSNTQFLDNSEKINNKEIDVVKKSSIVIGDNLQCDFTKGYGGSAQPIYDECCRKFAWDNFQRSSFGNHCSLYAKSVTPEGYSVLFLAHSNWTQTKGGEWSNKILWNTIEEVWQNSRDDMYHDDTIRVVFAKTKSYGYVFIGLYRPINLEDKVLPDGSRVFIKTYQRISDVYHNFQ